MKAFALFVSLLGLIWGGSAQAAVCTSLSAGDWNVIGRWSCGHIPVAADTVVIAHNAIRMRNNYTIAGITINAGAVLNDDGNNLTVNGNVIINGQLGTNMGGALRMRTAGATLSGTGIVKDITIEIDAANITLAAGSTLDFDPNAGIDVGANMAGSLIINGTVTAATQVVGDRIVRVSSGGALTVGTTGVINAPNSRLDVRTNASVTNNGAITIGDLRGRVGAPAPVFTQGANSTLNINIAACSAVNPCTFNAAAAGNTVNYSGAAQTVITPSGTYANLTLSGSGAKTVPTGLVVAKNFTMSGTATVVAPAALAVGGDFTIGAGNTFTPGAGAVTLNGAVPQTISGNSPLNFNNLTVTNAANPNITLATNVVVNGTLAGTVDLTSTCPTDWTLTSSGGTMVAHSCAAPDHILITHAGIALTCSPQAVTITACANAACTTPHYAGGVSVTLTPGGQTFVIDATGINNAATVQQPTAGVATLSAASVPVAYGASPTTCFNTATSTASCAMTFSDSGFVVTVPNHTSCPSATATIEAVQAAPGTGRCVPAYQNVTRAVNLYSTYVSPATGTQVVMASTGVVSGAAPGTAHNLDFDGNGLATITLNYSDAGQIKLTAGDTAPTGATMTGSSTFVVAPASFVFSATPPTPLTAGQAFNVTVTAMNACATPAATLNFNGVAALASSNPQPGIGNATAINVALGGFSSGVASTDLTWNEVGKIDLNASMSVYLGWTLPAPVVGAQVGVGRFHPAYFDTMVSPGCGTFTYAGSITPIKAGQPFLVTVRAKRFGGDAMDATNTANYSGANAYLTTLSDAGITAGFAGNAIAAANFINGVGNANVTYEVAVPKTVPITLIMRATNNDPTPVSSSGHPEGTSEIRSGRVKISNAYGSELLALPIPFRAEYWNGSWVLNSMDSCSGDGVGGGAVSVTLGALPVTCVQDSGNPGLSGAGCAAAGPAGQQFEEGGVIGFAGNFNLWLKAPGVGNAGYMAVTGGVPAWLQYPWGGGAATDPAARATFGVYGGRKEFIYMRENY